MAAKPKTAGSIQDVASRMIGQNTELTVKNGVLMIAVDLKGDPGDHPVSKSGKSYLIGSTGGLNKSLAHPNGSPIAINLNVTVDNPSFVAPPK